MTTRRTRAVLGAGLVLAASASPAALVDIDLDGLAPGVAVTDPFSSLDVELGGVGSGARLDRMVIDLTEGTADTFEDGPERYDNLRFDRLVQSTAIPEPMTLGLLGIGLLLVGANARARALASALLARLAARRKPRPPSSTS